MKGRLVRRGYGLGVALAVVFGLSILVAGAAVGGKGQSPNPDAGLTDAQRQQRYSSGRDAFEARYEAWVNSLDFSKINYSQLKHAPIMALYEPGQPTLGAAKAHAQMVVVGTVRSIRPTAFDGTYVTLDVGKNIKGSGSTMLVVHQGGGLMPTPDWKGMFIADALNAPLMLPKDRVILFLDAGTRGTPEVQSFTGLYQSRSGRVTPTQGNPFASQVSNSLETDFVSTVEAS